MVVRLPSMHTDSPGFKFPGHKKSAITNFLNPTFCNAYRRIFRDGEMALYVKNRPCKWGPEFEHLESIKTRHTVQVSVIPALVPRDRRWKQNCKLIGQLTWHTPWEKNKETRSPEGGCEGWHRGCPLISTKEPRHTWMSVRSHTHLWSTVLSCRDVEFLY